MWVAMPGAEWFARSTAVAAIGEAWSAIRADSPRHASPVSLDAVLPTAAESRTLGLIAGLSRGVGAALNGSTLVHWLRTVTARVLGLEAASLVALTGWVIMVAAITHLAMLLLVERYPFPKPTALALPIVMALVGLLTWALNGTLARAMADKRDR